MQFLPLEDAAGSPVEKLAKKQSIEKPGASAISLGFRDNKTDRRYPGVPFTISGLPYVHHIFRLPPYDQNRNAEDLTDLLTQAFVDLLDVTIQDCLGRSDARSGPPAYNLLMSLEHIHMIPREQENYTLKNGDKLSVNALGFAGMLMVKSEEEKAELLNEGPMTVLKSVGLIPEEGKDINLEVE